MDGAVFIALSENSGVGSKMRTMIVIAAAAAALWVSGCNTVAGVGRDVSAAGRAVTSTADDAKH
jgi:predicted small secreted protein